MGFPLYGFTRAITLLLFPSIVLNASCSAESSDPSSIGATPFVPIEQGSAAVSGENGGGGLGGLNARVITGDGGPSGTPPGTSTELYKDPPTGEENCGEATIKPVIEFIPGNLMVIFDRSMSMIEVFESTSRLNAAYYAILEGLQPFVCASDDLDCEEQLNVAAILLPSAPGGLGACYVEDINSQQQINWMGATQFVDTWKTYWQANPDPNILVLVLGTPITPAFEHAAHAIGSADLPGKTAVLFITDGLGTCGQGTSADAQAAEWLAQGISTYVVSVSSEAILFPGADGQAFNDGVASAGGTGQSLNPTDTEALNAALKDIMQSAAASPSCEVTLQGGDLADPQSACERGTVTVNGEVIACDQQNRADGFWVKSEDRIELIGSACEKLQSEGQLSASFPCDVIVLQ